MAVKYCEPFLFIHGGSAVAELKQLRYGMVRVMGPVIHGGSAVAELKLQHPGVVAKSVVESSTAAAPWPN